MGDEAPQWEYMVTTLFANAGAQQDFLEYTWPGTTFPRFAPQALIPDLNILGADGWELVSVEPVIYGVNGDVLTTYIGGIAGMDIGITGWTNAYQCFFKRHKATS